MDTLADIPAHLDIFGQPAIVDGVRLIGVFDAAYADAFSTIGGNHPVLTIPDLTSAPIGAAVSVASRLFTVASVERDGYGLALLHLEAC